jgi:hypothetical protein
MDEKSAIDIMAGIDKDTLNQIANFGGEYIDYLWWKDIIMPTIQGISIFVFIGLAVVVGIKVIASTSDEKE